MESQLLQTRGKKIRKIKFRVPPPPEVTPAPHPTSEPQCTPALQPTSAPQLIPASQTIATHRAVPTSQLKPGPQPTPVHQCTLAPQQSPVSHTRVTRSHQNLAVQQPTSHNSGSKLFIF